jgi:hypothetical protein
MRKISCIVFGCLLIGLSKAQSTNNDLIQIAEKFLVEVGDLEYHAPSDFFQNWRYDAKTKEFSSAMWVYDAVNEKDIRPDISVPVIDTLSYYRVSTFAHPDTPVHLMFAQNGKYLFINMHKDVVEVMRQGVELCKTLGLGDDNSLFVFKEILKTKEYDIKKRKGYDQLIQ